MTPHCLCVRELHHRWHLKRVFVPVFDRRIPVLTIWWFSWIQISHLYRLISCVHVIEASMSEQMNAEQSVNQCLWQIQWRFNRDSMDENISDCCSSLHARSIQDMKLLNCATPSLTCQITCVSAWLEAEDSFFCFHLCRHLYFLQIRSDIREGRSVTVKHRLLWFCPFLLHPVLE